MVINKEDIFYNSNTYSLSSATTNYNILNNNNNNNCWSAQTFITYLF